MGPTLPTYVGALFQGADATGRPFCTASVVASRRRNLVLTAAHCLDNRTATDIVFVPGFDDGYIPHAVWHVNAAYLDPRWQQDADPSADFAFLTVDDQTQSGKATSLQATVGGERLLARTAAGRRVHVVGRQVSVIGYPEGVHAHPIVCKSTVTAQTKKTTVQRKPKKVTKYIEYPRFNCNGYVDGTSGGPWLVSSATRSPFVVGVIGGWQQGGNSAATSYSAPFGLDIAMLYRTATGAP
ncbi:MAG TPA: trypsin-like peptidase domain-containing protein [Acidimicrobiia bacterium]